MIAVTKAKEHFKLLGQAMAKALQDNRLLDVPLSPIFLQAAFQQPLDLMSLSEVDSGLGSTLEKLQTASKHASNNPDGHILVDGVPIEDLCLTFVVPGYPEYTLKAGGADIAITAENVDEYITAVMNATLREGIKIQMAAFRYAFPLAQLEYECCLHLLLGCVLSWLLMARFSSQGQSTGISSVDTFHCWQTFRHGYPISMATMARQSS